MDKNDEGGRNQREFFLVFSSASQKNATAMLSTSEPEAPEGKTLSTDQVKAHRAKLIAELREFGC